MRDVTAVILCGGAGKRMGGEDKPLLEHAGRPLLQHIVDELAPACARILISANRNEDVYEQYGKVIADQEPGRGPLEGIASCLDKVNTPWAFVCPGDAPFVVEEIPRRLMAALEGRTERLAVAHDGARRQHLHVLLSADHAAAIREYLDTGQRSVYAWLESQPLVEVVMDDLAMAFADLDEPGDLD